MNIRVDLDTPIRDGMEVKFRSPEDCSQVTGLIVYSGNDSKEFMFADAHGENVGDIDHLFAEGAVVKVILDITTSKAFVQNADTNAYIERTFIKSVNGVGPDENGNVRVSGGGGTGGEVSADEFDYLSRRVDTIEGSYVTTKDIPTKLSQLNNDLGFVDENTVIHEIIPSVVSSTLSGYENDVGYQTEAQVNALINTALGDVESALDAVIAIQNGLIGGNA